MNETEKMTINLGVVEIAQIDVLVEQGVYSNRSDFIRTAVRRQLETHSERIENQLTPISNTRDWTKIVGIFNISKKVLEKLSRNNEKIKISVIGMLVVDKNISTSLFEKTVEDVMLKGKLVASDEIKEVLKSM